MNLGYPRMTLAKYCLRVNLDIFYKNELNLIKYHSKKETKKKYGKNIKFPFELQLY